ncbi:MAG TPA: ABC transporter ATP-binding protein [Gaiellales bacterium]|jgi:multiple sugar transport system ATP-binding protein|nr:ABC transporter ATP-binding protein [Gaiellales bacterium]
MDVRYEAICKTFGATDAVSDLDLHVPDGAFLALLGPSGCGKTTALRILAGLEEPTSGRVLIGARDVTRLQPKDRDVAMVFQSYALYPHKNVADNIAYPLRVRKVAPAERARRVAEVARMLDIDGLLERAPRQLSGGQRQRVALARAIVRQPQAFLMDEPLSNLDAQLRLHMRAEIKRLQRDLGTTTVYVTHDQVEAMTMADLVAVMRAGRLQQVAPPGEIYARPANLFVARFCGSPPMNVLEGDAGGGRFRHPAGDIDIGSARHQGPVKLGFRPEHARITAAGEPGALAGEVYVVEPLGNETLVAITVGEGLVNLRAPAGFDPAVGAPCGVRPDPAHVHLFDPTSDASIYTADPEGTAAKTETASTS